VVQPGREVAAPAGASLTVRAGEMVAVTGASGAGKSTLLAVILGLERASSGRVLAIGAGGTAAVVAELDGEAWRTNVAWVPQEPFLFAGSVADNVRLAVPDAVDADVAEVLAAVGMADVDPGLLLGERGLGLSSGQRRRLGVARALLRQAPLLLLDEPTAGLDDVAEATVLAAIRGAARSGAAVLLVAHRPAAAAAADRSVVVSWRALGEMGSATDLEGTPATFGATAGAA
jgi:ABC-type transport system involved in cytochrome bd biosynthesis fused ATPase/permease subunit